MNPFLLSALVWQAMMGEDKLFDADYRTNEKAQFGFNEAEFIKIEDLTGEG